MNRKKNTTVEGFFQGTLLTDDQVKAFGGRKAVEVVDNGGKKAIIVRGYASTLDRDRYGDIVEPTAFENSIGRFKENGIILLQHKHDKPIGKPLEGTQVEKEKGLFLEAMITEDVDGVFSAIENGVLKGFSIGFRIMPGWWEYKEIEVDGETDYVFVIKEIDLYEVSIVSVPANPYTFMKSIKKSLEGALEAQEGQEAEPAVTEAPAVAGEALSAEDSSDGDENPSETGGEAENAEVDAETVAEAVANPEEDAEKSVPPKAEVVKTEPEEAQKAVKELEASFEKKFADMEKSHAEAVTVLVSKIGELSKTVSVIVDALKSERRSVGLSFSETPEAAKPKSVISKALEKARS